MNTIETLREVKYALESAEAAIPNNITLQIVQQALTLITELIAAQTPADDEIERVAEALTADFHAFIKALANKQGGEAKIDDMERIIKSAAKAAITALKEQPAPPKDNPNNKE